MRSFETERLMLRPITKNDFHDIHSYAGSADNLLFMPWGPNSEEQTRDFIDLAIAKSQESPPTDFYFAVVLKETGELIGDCELRSSGDSAKLGWILRRSHWRRGFGTEIGKALLRFGFEELKLHRITAECDAENEASFRLMEKIGMRREGLLIASRPTNSLASEAYRDGLLYAMLSEEWETMREIAHYNALPCVFNGFIDLPALSDGEIYLVCTEKRPAIPEKKYVPSYFFAICLGGEKIGTIDLRIGYVDGLYYGGQIGYNIDEAHRGHGYAGRACRLLRTIAKAHGMQKLLITNVHTNNASRRVCEKLGARILRVARLPQWHDLYKEEQRFVNVFEWSVE